MGTLKEDLLQAAKRNLTEVCMASVRRRCFPSLLDRAAALQSVGRVSERVRRCVGFIAGPWPQVSKGECGGAACGRVVDAVAGGMALPTCAEWSTRACSRFSPPRMGVRPAVQDAVCAGCAAGVCLRRLAHAPHGRRCDPRAQHDPTSLRTH